jgi:hypothetical protein
MVDQVLWGAEKNMGVPDLTSSWSEWSVIQSITASASLLVVWCGKRTPAQRGWWRLKSPYMRRAWDGRRGPRVVIKAEVSRIGESSEFGGLYKENICKVRVFIVRVMEVIKEDSILFCL